MSTEMNEMSSSSSVATPSRPTQSPLHSASESPREDDGRPGSLGVRGARSRARTRRWPSPGDRRVEPVVLLVVVLGECRGGHGRRGVLVHGLLVDREDLGGAVALLQLEVAGGLELHRLVVRVVVGERDVDLEIGVVEDVLLALLRRRRRRRGQRLLGLRTAWRRLRRGFAGLASRSSSSLSGASSIESAWPSPKPAPWRLIPESLGRDRLIPEVLGSAAVTSESLGL